MGLRDRLLTAGRGLAGAAGQALVDLAVDPGELIKAGTVPTEPAAQQEKSLLWDPFAVIEQLGFREKPTRVNYGTLKEMVQKVEILQSIIQTRINQVASFAKPSHDRHQLGFRIQTRESEKEPTKQDKIWARDAEKLIMANGIPEDPRVRNSFEAFLRKFTRDSLVMDQGCFEVVPNRKGQPAKWYAVDAATMRLADVASTYNKEDPDQTIRYVQIYDGIVIAEYTAEEMCFGIRNPRTDIRLFGYGTSETEMLIKTVTAMLYGWEYNVAAFRNASVLPGILNFKGSIPDKQLKAFRRHWYLMLSGVQNCVAGDTELWTCDGAIPISEIIGERDECETRIWTGAEWVSALAYRTKEQKKLIRTTLGNGVTVSTSPDHRFRVIGNSGEPEWKCQADLEIGDFVLINKQISENRRYSLPKYKGKPLTPGLMEALGWLVGDGAMSFSGHGHQKSNYAKWFYHHDKETDIRTRHLDVLMSYDNAAASKDTVLTSDQVEHIKEHYGFSSVAPVRRSILLCSVDFVEWLVGLGFKSSKAGKVVPGFVYALPQEHKTAFLRGLFSADGHVQGGHTPGITIANDILRRQVKLLLLSLGIRTSFYEGKKKLRIEGSLRSYVEAKSLLRIKDRDRFFEMIGFLQSYKKQDAPKKPNEKNKYSRIGHSAVLRYLRKVRAANDASGKTLLTRRQRLDLNSIFFGADGCSLPRLIRFLGFVNIAPPAWMTGYNFEPVVEIEDTGESVDMYDVHVYDDEHQFIGNGVVLHNSFKTPITNADEMQWLKLKDSNRDMEYSAWYDFLLKIACSLFQIDSVEVNFKYGNTGQRGAGLNEQSNKEKITESKERGLRPLLRFIAGCINTHIIWPMNEDFEFDFVGLDSKTRDDVADLNKKLVSTTRMVDELRAEDDLEPLPDGKGEVILDPTWMQWAQQKDAAAAGVEGGEEGEAPDFTQMFGEDEEGEEEEPKQVGAKKPEKTEEEPEEKPVKKSLAKGNGRRYPRYVVDMEL
jgi:intein/homing endonuclease